MSSNFGSCSIIKLLCKKMPLVWLLDKCYLFIRSIMSILVSVSGEISSGAIDLAQENLEMLVRIARVTLSSPAESASECEKEFYTKLTEQQKTAVEDISKELIRQVKNINTYLTIILFLVYYNKRYSINNRSPLPTFMFEASPSNLSSLSPKSNKNQYTLQFSPTQKFS